MKRMAKGKGKDGECVASGATEDVTGHRWAMAMFSIGLHVPLPWTLPCEADVRVPAHLRNRLAHSESAYSDSEHVWR